MSTDLITTNGASSLERTPEREALIREQFGLQAATATEIEYLFAVASRTGLDPVQKQLYGIMRWDKRAGREKLTVQVGIDGLRSIAARSKEYGGSDDAVFAGNGDTLKATVTVYRIVQGHRCPFTASARWSEYVQTTKTGHPSGQWGSKPFVMLAKCAEALALRKAFPAELGGLYTDAEMQQTHGDVEEVAALTPGQASCLRDLSKRAGVADAVADVRIGNMKANEYDRAVERLEQRIREQETVEAAKTDEQGCGSCSGTGSVDGDDTCGDCAGSGLAA
jgi:phage recombination protein Bet